MKKKKRDRRIKWTPERIEKLRRCADQPWRILERRFNCSKSNLVKVMYRYGIRRQNVRAAVWSDEVDKIIIAAALNSQQYDSYTSSGRKELRRLLDITIQKLKAIGFKGNLTGNIIRMRLKAIDQKRLEELGFENIGVSLLGWGTESYRNPKKVEQAIEARIAELIRANALNELGEEGLYIRIETEFANQLRLSGYVFDKKIFSEKVEKILWGDGKEGSPAHSLKDCIRHNIPLNEFSKYYPYIPKQIRDKKAKWYKGQVSGAHAAAFISGIGRLPLEGEQIVKLPSSTYRQPWIVSIPDDKKNPSCILINGANIGAPYNPIIEDNRVRLGLDYAKDNKADFVMLINLLDIETKKTSGYIRVLRTLASGRNINLKVFDPDYLEEAERILATLPEDELIYETRNEVFEDLMSAWFKISRVPPEGKKPQYSGKIYIIIGYKEEQLAAAAAYWAVAYYNRKKQDELAALRKMIVYALNKARKEGEESEIVRLEQELKRIRKQEARTRITNIEVEWRRFFQKALSYIIRRIEETIPNSKVIGKGTSYIKVKEQLIEFYIPSHIRVTDGLLAERVKSYGQDILFGRAADLVVVCHPYALGYAATAREIDRRGRRDKRGFICVAPICVDDEVIRETTKEILHRSVHPLLKAVFSDQFSAGVLRIDFVDGIPFASPVELQNKKKHINPSRSTKSTKPLAGSYIWYLEATDQHHGGRSKERIWCEELEKYLGMCESVFYLLRKAGYGRNLPPPIHIYSANDDPTQGEHFGTHKHPHRHQLHYFEIENHIAEFKDKILRARNYETRVKLLCDLQIFVLYQFEIRGVDWVSNQLVEIYSRHLEPNADMYSGILLRATQAGLILRGLSDLLERPEVLRDTADVGFINWGSGNHFIKTVNGHLTEGGIYASQLRLLLRAFPEWQGKDELLKKYITGPLYGNRAIAMGTLQAPGGYEWGLDLRDTVPKMQGWLDPLKGVVKNESERGNYGRFMENKVTLRSYGDKHFFAARRTQSSIHVMGPAGTHTDEYGEWGFPPNNTGVLFVGLPAEGPKAGPILIRPLLYQDLYRFMQRKEVLDWETILPNAL